MFDNQPLVLQGQICAEQPALLFELIDKLIYYLTSFNFLKLKYKFDKCDK